MLRLCQPQISEAAIEAVNSVLRSGQLVHGSQGEAFELELANYLGCNHAVLVSSGTAALHLALMALGVGPGDAVLVPDFTFPATANVVSHQGARTVLVDVNPSSYTIDLRALELQLANWQGPERLRAVMPVHEFGSPVEMDVLLRLAQQHDLLVIEDAACAIGASYQGIKLGTWGDIGCFSFHPRKTLTTGEGGLLSTNDPMLAQRLRRLRSHGMQRVNSKVNFIEPGLNYRLTDLQSVLGRHQLPLLDSWVARRRELVDLYRQQLAPLEALGLLRLPKVIDGHSYQTFMLVLTAGTDRAVVIKELVERGIEANLGAQSLSTLGIYGTMTPLPVGSELYTSGLAIPLHESLTKDDVMFICEALSKLLTS